MKNEEKNILLIVCFFGVAPWYLKFFLRTAAINSAIDFLLVTDNLEINAPSNFRTVLMQLTDLEKMAQERLGCEVALKFPYKICDIRPAYGVIFEDYLSDYDFWGYCDVDVVFGDIRGFLSNEVLEQYDIISARPEFLPGYFSLYRNTALINQLFRCSKDHLLVFKSPQYLNFDECSFNHEALFDGKLTQDLDFKTESMTYLLKHKCINDGIRTLFDLLAIDFTTGKMYWNNGILTYDNKFEILLYHLIDYKRKKSCVIPDWDEVPDQFYIHKDTFSYTEVSA